MIPKSLGQVIPAMHSAQREREAQEVADILQMNKDVVLDAFKRYDNNKDLAVNYLMQSVHGHEQKDNLAKYNN